jgi:UDP-2-acetamido-2-deoxy-ribo-hexuluronate aminotransferase
MAELRNHGQDRRYHHPRLGINGRMDSMQAAVILAKLTVFADEVVARDRIGRRYSELLAGCGCVTPFLEPYNTSVFAQYTLQVDDRERVQTTLSKASIPTAVHYPVTLDRQPALAERSRVTGNLRIARALAKRVVSLPMHPYLGVADQERIATAVRQAL